MEGWIRPDFLYGGIQAIYGDLFLSCLILCERYMVYHQFVDWRGNGIAYVTRSILAERVFSRVGIQMIGKPLSYR